MKNKRYSDLMNYPTKPFVAAKAVLGLTEKQIASKAKTSEVSVRQVLRGEAKKITPLMRTAKALGLRVRIEIEEVS